MMKKNLLRIALGLLGILVVGQLFRPRLENPATDSSLSVRNYPGVPPEVIATLDRSCFDCHSNEARWPWYSYITPVNYFIANDINAGRRHVNFSEWNNYSSGKLKSALDNIYDQVYNHQMPLASYQWMHPKARLSQADVKMICDWASGEEDRLDQVSEMQSDINKGKENHDAAGTKK